MKTIVVPLDFSNVSMSGLNMALMLADKSMANIEMVHVIESNKDNRKEFLEKENKLAEINFEKILQLNKII